MFKADWRRARRSMTCWFRRLRRCAKRQARAGPGHFDVQLIGGMVLHKAPSPK